MRWLLLLPVAAVVGTIAGFATTYLEMAGAREQFRPVNAVEPKVAVQPAADPQAKQPAVEVVGGTEFNFGTMERSSTMSHAFVFKNVGEAPLTLATGRTTCRCTLSKLSGNAVAPGETAEVKLEWNAKSQGANPEFSVAAEIHTNDPKQRVIQLYVRGLVTENLRTSPAEVTIGRISANTDYTTQFRIYNYLTPELQVVEHNLLDAAHADRFELTFVPLTAEQLQQEVGAQSGLECQLTVKSGLPLGPVHQTIRVLTNLGPESELRIPIDGTVTSDILLAGARNFSSELSLLNLGEVRSSQGAKGTVFLYIKGAYRNDVRLSAGDSEPAGAFRATIGPRQELNQGRTIKYEVTVEVPPGVAPMNRLGSENAPYGVVVIETTHPEAKKVPIYIRIAILPD